MDHVKITRDELSVDEARKLVICPSAGAVSMFIGTTRDNFENKTVVRLEYEAYESMAVKEINKICKSVRDRWNVRHICIMHRLGLVPVTEASVLIAISSAHRNDSLEAVRFAIDTLKATVPIWKKEVYADGECSWKENAECSWNSTPQCTKGNQVINSNEVTLNNEITENSIND